MKKVVVIGPECTGKTDLSKFLASYFHTVFVEEYAREFLNNLARPYKESDLIAIAKGQVHAEAQQERVANRILICDTNVIVIKVWSEFKFGRCDTKILNLLPAQKVDLYLLTYIDIPWENDPLREHPDRREELWRIYQQEIEKTGVPSVIIRDTREERRKKAVDAIEKLMQKDSIATNLSNS